MSSARLAVTRGSFWRSEPAAELRGLANGAFPASSSDSLSRSNASTGRNTSPRTSIRSGTGNSVGAGQPVGHRLDRADVGRHVLAGAAVATGEGPLEPATLVEQVDGEPVDLQLAQQRGLLDAVASQAGVPALELVVGERVVEALHPPQVVDRGELGRDRATDLLRRASPAYAARGTPPRAPRAGAAACRSRRRRGSGCRGRSSASARPRSPPRSGGARRGPPRARPPPRRRSAARTECSCGHSAARRRQPRSRPGPPDRRRKF